MTASVEVQAIVKLLEKIAELEERLSERSIVSDIMIHALVESHPDKEAFFHAAEALLQPQYAAQSPSPSTAAAAQEIARQLLGNWQAPPPSPTEDHTR